MMEKYTKILFSPGLPPVPESRFVTTQETAVFVAEIFEGYC
jgi:hypothetical protein